MCLILFAWRAHPRYELVLAANRDEFHERPAAAAGFWAEHDEILAGRDLEAGGTWLGVTRHGRFAALTNYRETPRSAHDARRSRGQLVTAWLTGADEPLEAAGGLAAAGTDYAGFNLLLGRPGELVYLSNRGVDPRPVTSGLHGLSNHLLDTDWPKVSAGRERLAALLADETVDPERLFDLLTDTHAVGGTLPDGVAARLAPENLARQLFIRSPVYGTRCSTVLLLGRDGEVFFEERRFDAAGRPAGAGRFRFAT
ncbi:MAG: NRDE family protein [Xanthomonadales bacterium]